MTAGPRIDQYDWAGGHEAMLRFGPDTGPVAVLALPLLEEANRTRGFAVAVLRALAERGVAGALPDVPGQGESLLPLETLSLDDLRTGFAAAVAAIARGGRRCYAVGIRSGALLDAGGVLGGRWHLSPQDGPALLREWRRIAQAASTARPEHRAASDAATLPDEIAGNYLSAALLSDLTAAKPNDATDGAPVRVLRLEGDPRPADRHVPGTPLWRRSEPGNDPAFAALLADDIAGWIAQCEG